MRSVVAGAVRMRRSPVTRRRRQSGSVSPGGVDSRRTNQSERGSSDRLDRAAPPSTVAPDGAGEDQRQLEGAHLGQVVLQLGDPADQPLDLDDVDDLARRGSRRASARP